LLADFSPFFCRRIFVEIESELFIF